MTERSWPIYLDHNASTPLLPEVLDAMLPYLAEHYGNPSSSHIYGRTMRAAVETARERVASLIDCEPGEVFFTSGGTEANNLAIRGVAEANPGRRHVVTSVIEHPAASEPCAWLETQGYRVDRVPVDETGTVRLSAIGPKLGNETALLTIMHANSETGSLQPIRPISRLAHDVGALMHSDAAQSLGKIPVSVQQEEIDLLSVAGHKLYAPQGVGALFVRTGTRIKPVLLGAGHERGLRPGTENVASIVGLGAACKVAERDLLQESQRVSRLRDHLWTRLQEKIPGLDFNGHPLQRLPNTLSLLFPGVSGDALLAACPAIAASTGSACHEDGAAASSVILAMGVAADRAIGTVRLTLGRGNSRHEIDRAADALIEAWRSLAKKP